MAENTKSGKSDVAASVSTHAPAAQQVISMEQAMALIAQSIAKQSEFQEALVKSAPKRRRTMEEYLKDNPRKKLLHEVYQNGRPVNPSGLSVSTIQKLDTLATGIYCEGLITVHRISDGINGANSRIHIMYSNRELGQRMQFYIKFPTFTSIVNAVAEEMAARKIPPVHEATAVESVERTSE